MSRTPIVTTGAPVAIGPYSQAIQSGDLLFVSGQLALDPDTGEMIDGEVGAQTERALRNLEGILTAAGATCADVVKTTVYLADMNDFATMNRMYATFFADPAPARAAVQVARLPKDALVEIDCIARVSATTASSRG